MPNQLYACKLVLDNKRSIEHPRIDIDKFRLFGAACDLDFDLMTSWHAQSLIHHYCVNLTYFGSDLLNLSSHGGGKNSGPNYLAAFFTKYFPKNLQRAPILLFKMKLT